MKNILKTYKSVIILLAAIIIGAILGMALKENAAVLKPFGDIFLNLLFVTIVPLVFLSITTSISRIKQPKRIGKIMITIIATFVVMSLISVLVGIVSTYSFKLVNTEDGAQIRASLEEDSGETSSTETDEKEPTILDRTVSALTVTDFSKLLSKDNILPLVVFSILFGVAIKMAGEKGEAIQKTLESAYEVTLKFVQLISYTNRTWLLFCCSSWNLWKCNSSWIRKNIRNLYFGFNSILHSYVLCLCLYRWWKKRINYFLEEYNYTNSSCIGNMFICSSNTCKHRSC